MELLYLQFVAFRFAFMCFETLMSWKRHLCQWMGWAKISFQKLLQGEIVNSEKGDSNGEEGSYLIGSTLCRNGLRLLRYNCPVCWKKRFTNGGKHPIKKYILIMDEDMSYLGSKEYIENLDCACLTPTQVVWGQFRDENVQKRWGFTPEILKIVNECLGPNKAFLRDGYLNAYYLRSALPNGEIMDDARMILMDYMAEVIEID